MDTPLLAAGQFTIPYIACQLWRQFASTGILLGLSLITGHHGRDLSWRLEDNLDDESTVYEKRRRFNFFQQNAVLKRGEKQSGFRLDFRSIHSSPIIRLDKNIKILPSYRIKYQHQHKGVQMSAQKVKRTMIQTGRVFDLSQLVDYGDGAVVSRTLIENSAGTVTLFAFDKQQGLSEHTAPFDALVLVVEGKGEFNIHGTIHQVGSGEMIVMPANVPHAVRANEAFKMMLTMLRE